MSGDGHHHHDHAAAPEGLWGRAMAVAGLILAVEAAGAVASHSLALYSDAGHMLTDVGSLGLAWYAARLALRGPTPRRTYGFHRAGILTALFNAALLVLVAGGILADAVGRFRHPEPVTPWIMWVVAAVGVAGNLYVGLRLGHAGGAHGDLNVRGAWLHVMGDAAASAGVLAAGVLISLTHRLWWHPLVSVGIALLIARGAWRLVGQTVNVLMEGTPPGIEPSAVAAAIEEDPQVRSVHHVHVWSLDGRRTALSGHVVVGDVRLSETEDVLRRVGAELRRRFGIDHATLQLESHSDTEGCPEADCLPAESHHHH